MNSNLQSILGSQEVAEASKALSAKEATVQDEPAM